MAAWTAAARQASNFSRLSSPKSLVSGSQAANLIQRRGLAGGGGNPPLLSLMKIRVFNPSMSVEFIRQGLYMHVCFYLC